MIFISSPPDVLVTRKWLWREVSEMFFFFFFFLVETSAKSCAVQLRQVKNSNAAAGGNQTVALIKLG